MTAANRPAAVLVVLAALVAGVRASSDAAKSNDAFNQPAPGLFGPWGPAPFEPVTPASGLPGGLLGGLFSRSMPGRRMLSTNAAAAAESAQHHSPSQWGPGPFNGEVFAGSMPYYTGSYANPFTASPYYNTPFGHWGRRLMGAFGGSSSSSSSAGANSRRLLAAGSTEAAATTNYYGSGGWGGYSSYNQPWADYGDWGHSAGGWGGGHHHHHHTGWGGWGRKLLGVANIKRASWGGGNSGPGSDNYGFAPTWQSGTSTGRIWMG